MTTAALATRTVLLVDDEQDVRNVLALLLRRAGYCVLEAAGPGEALRLAGEADLLLTDLTLREGSGTDLAERLTAERPGLPVLFMSGGESREGIDRTPSLPSPLAPSSCSARCGRRWEAKASRLFSPTSEPVMSRTAASL